MSDDGDREVVVRRVEHGHHEAINVRGGTLRMGTGDTADFTPVELLLAAVAGCTGLDVDFITSRRAEPEAFSLTVTARKVRDEGAGDAAREALPLAITRSHDRLCTVSRTVQLGAEVKVGQA